MAFKLIAFTALLAVARAGIVPTHGYAAAPAVYAHAAPAVYSHAAPAVYSHAAPAVYAHAAPAVYAHAAPVHAKVLVAEAPADYSFQYGVHDAHTGDVKEQHEENHGGVVKGYYTLNDADGTKRTVHYTADDHNGFNAVVQREGHPVHPVAVKAVAPVIKAVHAAPVYAHAAPAVYSHAAPAVYAHAAPVAVAHAAPVYAHAAPQLAYASHGYHH